MQAAPSIRSSAPIGECERLHVRHRVCEDEQESAVPIGRSRVPTRTDTGPTRTDTEILPEYCRQFNVSVLLVSVCTENHNTLYVQPYSESGEPKIPSLRAYDGIFR